MALRGISEFVSAALLALIVLGIGAIVVSRIVENTYIAAQNAENELVEARVKGMKDLAISLAYISSKDNILHVVVVTSEAPVKIEAIYLNNTLWNNDCEILLTNGKTYTRLPVLIPYYTAAHIKCRIPPSSSFAYIKLVYDGGEVSAAAKRI